MWGKVQTKSLEMKKTGILNCEISEVVASMGHQDKLCICDAGLPIPPGTDRIDLALAEGIPGFIQTLKVVLKELEVEAIVLAKEIKSASSGSKKLHKEIRKIAGDIPLSYYSHEQFKDHLYDCRAVIRTGEFTPYANIMLVSGVVF